ncbi:carbonic anhydrase 13-like [Anopheles stephensi]|uniref:carbonic anhydrase 13-like n=1 Tax=Anopheles stephensi TaxID=30069 RepID=UPI001658C08C|nr:carbonic anhydrase 13-like [Anopheles stephensi]XP_035891486.1 carbonic anhydrase 13-like [Anopheles stephensi]
MQLLKWHGQLILLNFLMFMSWRPCRGLNVPNYGTPYRGSNPTRRSGVYSSVREPAYYDEYQPSGPKPLTEDQRRAKLTAVSNPDFYFPPDPEADLAETNEPEPEIQRSKPRVPPAAPGSFSYNEKDKNGPSHWYRVDARCGGRYQSPILLNTSSAQLVSRKRPLRLDGQTNLPQTILLQNDGHSAKFTYNWRNGDRPVLRGGPLKTKYLFDQFHFHWGVNSTVGSEHVYDYQRYPMEIHLVFYNGLYESFQEAREQVDGIAVVGLFYEIYQHSVDEQLNTWTRFLRNVVEPNSEFTIPFIDTFPLYEVIGDVEWPYFSYEGSLTTPPCLETVTWIVSTKPLLVTEKEMRQFRRLQSPTGLMVNNYRPVQKLNHRRVFLY